MKHLKKSFKSLLIVCLTLMLSITTLVANTNTVSADGDYSLEVFYGLGRGKAPSGYSMTGVFTGAGAMLNNDTGYSLKGYRDTAYHSGGSNSGAAYRCDQPRQDTVSSAEIFYNGSKYTLNAIVSSKGFNVLNKTIYYTSGGTLTATASGNTKLATFAPAGQTTGTESVAVRWLDIPGEVVVIYHYYDEHTITVNNVEGTQTNIDNRYDNYYKTEITGGTKTIISGDYTAGIEMSYTLNAGETLSSVGINVGSNSATCNTVTGVQYLSSSYTFSDTSATGDILSINFDTKKITYNSITSDITVNFIYANTTTYDVVFMVGGVQYGETQEIVSGDVAIRPTDPSAQTGYVFDYWHTLGSSTAYDFSTPITDNLTLYGEFIEQYTFTFNGVKSVSSSTWVAKTGGAGFSGSTGVYTATTKGAYTTATPADSTSSGFSLSFDYTTAVNGASIQVGTMVANIPAEWFAASASLSRYLDDQGIWYETFAAMTSEGNTPVMKLAHNTQSGAESRLFIRLWNMESDITITTSIGDRKVIFTNFGHGYYSSSGAWLTGNNISFSTWESSTGGVLYANPKAAIDAFGEEYHQSMGTVPGDYDNNTGVGGSLKTIIADLDTITFTYGAHTPIVLNVDGGTGIKGKTFYINSNYELEERTAKATGDLFKMSTSSTATDTINVRFYKVVEDINIEATYSNEHTITIKNYNDHIEAGAFSPSTSGSYVGINCWDPYGISDASNHTGLRAGGTLDTVNGIATVYGDYSQASGIGAGLKIPTNFLAYNKLIITYGEETVQYNLTNESDNSRIFKVGDTDILRVTVYENEDCYYLRFLKIDDDITIEAKSEGINDHIVRFENASSASCSTWESVTGGIPFSSVGNHIYEASTVGNYVNTTYGSNDGVKTWLGLALGEIESVTFAFNNRTFTLNADDFASSFSNVFVDIEGNQYTNSTTPNVVYAFKVAYTLGDQGIFIRFYNITNDITVTATYSQYVNVDFVYDDETISSQRILSGTYAEVPEDPASATGQEFMWYTDEEHTTLFDPEARIYESVTLYGALASDIHHVYFNGLGFQYRSIQTPPAYLSSSTWATKTGGFVNTQSGHFVTNGDYSSETGVAVAGRTSNYYVDKVEIKVGDNDPVYL